jgi:hypothetical protein
MTQKNPFEIRTEMLQLAKDYLDQQYHMNIQFAERMVEQGVMAAEDIKKAYAIYSMDELMEKAKEMYSFVSDKGTCSK